MHTEVNSMQTRTISICIGVLAGITASIGITAFSSTASANENSVLSDSSVSSSVVESTNSSCADIFAVESVARPDITSASKVGKKESIQKPEESKVDETANKAIDSKTADSKIVNSEIKNSPSTVNCPTVTVTTEDGTIITYTYPVQENAPSVPTPGGATAKDHQVANDPDNTK